jgi:hypothetical protein
MCFAYHTCSLYNMTSLCEKNLSKCDKHTTHYIAFQQPNYQLLVGMFGMFRFWPEANYKYYILFLQDSTFKYLNQCIAQCPPYSITYLLNVIL